MENKDMVYGPLELPSGRVIRFRAPKGIDRMNILQMMKMDNDNLVSGSLMLDEYLKSKCITEVDGASVTLGFKTVMSNWLEQDIIYYKTVFEEMFGQTEEMQKRAKEAATFLLKGVTSSDGCSAQNMQA